MNASAKAARLSERERTTQAKPRVRAVTRKLLDVDPTLLNRALHAINRANQRDEWFDFLRHVE